MVDEYGSSLTAIPPNNLHSFKNLRKIEVKNYESMEQVFDLEWLSPDDALLQELRELLLINIAHNKGLGRIGNWDARLRL